jgi:DNA-binding response OmpR family regulator
MNKTAKTKVLIVEDEPDIAGLMRHALERGGALDAEIVGTGAAALKVVMEDPPGLILLDLNLPFIDGVEVCRLLRSRPTSSGIPIIMVTARTGEDDRVSGLELGAGSAIKLTKREFELLCFLVENRNRVISRDRLLERVWGVDRQVETRSVDVHVGRLRGKLGSAARQIETVIGMGYRFVEEPDSAPALD